MHHFDSKAVEKALPYPLLANALAQGLQQAIEAPPRSHLTPNHDASCVLIMPAWRPHQLMGVKLVSVWPGNNTKGESAVSGVYVLISCENGHPVAVLDGTALTLRPHCSCGRAGGTQAGTSEQPNIGDAGNGRFECAAGPGACGCDAF